MAAPKFDLRPLFHHRVEEWRDGVLAPRSDLLAEEIPLQLRYNRRPYTVMMVTPTDLKDFALGFTLSEGIVAGTAEVENLRIVRHADHAEAWVKVPASRAAALRRRNLPGRSGCGLCGTSEVADALRPAPRLNGATRIGPDALQRAVAGLDAAQSLNAETGAAHAALWCGPDGSTHLAREDVGRHNALDKLIGALHRAGPRPPGFALITSRASYEMVQKAAHTGIDLLAAVSAPTGLAVRLAEQSGLTLIGFARRGRHVVYTHPWRLA